MEPLWTPWRMPYIQAIKSGGGCVFCEKVLDGGVEADLVIHRGRHVFVLMNLYPYTTGHLLIVPYRHVASLSDLEPAEAEEMAALLQRAEQVVEAALGARRHHVGINLGRCAGAGVEGHLHVHLVPRAARPLDDSGEPAAATPPPALSTTVGLLRGHWIDPADHMATS